MLKLPDLIANNVICFDDIFKEIYLFGSVLTSNNPNDIDILLLYNKENNSLNYIINKKNSSLYKIYQHIKLEIHSVMMSYDEYKKYNFIKNTTNYRKIR